MVESTFTIKFISFQIFKLQDCIQRLEIMHEKIDDFQGRSKVNVNPVISVSTLWYDISGLSTQLCCIFYCSTATLYAAHYLVAVVVDFCRIWSFLFSLSGSTILLTALLYTLTSLVIMHFTSTVGFV